MPFFFFVGGVGGGPAEENLKVGGKLRHWEKKHMWSCVFKDKKVQEMAGIW